MNPLVSIIVPIYNAEKYIEATIASCIGQTYANIELILINDGSTDGTEDIIKSFSDSRIRYHKIDNVGACEARNIGIKQANGELYQFLDHDDLLDSGKISAQMSYYTKYGENYIYSCKMGSVSDQQVTVDEGYELYYKDFTPQEYFETVLNQFGKFITTGAWLIPAKILNTTHGWDSRAGINDDGEYFTRLILNSKGIKFCSEGVFYFRRDAVNSLSKQFGKREVYVKWLYSYKSYVASFLKYLPESTAKELGRKALSKYYCSSYPNHPDLLQECKDEIRKLGFKTPTAYGGKLFMTLSQAFGVDVALKIYSLKRRLTS